MNIYIAGKTVVGLLYPLFKAVQVYDVNNNVVINTAQKFMSGIEELLTTFSSLEFVRYRDYVFFNKQRLKYEIDSYANLQFMNTQLKTLNIKSITFKRGVTQQEVIDFASIFKEDRASFQRLLPEKKLPHINIELLKTDKEPEEPIENGQMTKRTYFKALKVTKNLMQNLWTGRPVDVKSSRRVIYGLVDSISRDEFGILALTTIKNFDEYTFNHSLNVGILALALGQRIGLDRKNLARLGTSGILHDIGKVEISKELINKIQKLTDQEWETLKLHSNYGVREILKTRGLDEISMFAITVAYQHHWNYDGTGYPLREKEDEPTLFSRIVRICDSYDAMTTARGYQPVPYLPHFALRVIWSNQNRLFDPILAKVFTQLLGIYPVGSCLELSTGEIGVVMRQNPSAIDLPNVKIVVDSNNNKIDGRTIDLASHTEIKIIRPTYPQIYGINPAAYFL
ncbi:MAG: HD-GYP domain-containing protein [candidate division WOR-3 bacterium]|nr:HD-GYP domain-containing protein [candidate division WOR-3 bacterium]